MLLCTTGYTVFIMMRWQYVYPLVIAKCENDVGEFHYRGKQHPVAEPFQEVAVSYNNINCYDFS